MNKYLFITHTRYTHSHTVVYWDSSKQHLILPHIANRVHNPHPKEVPNDLAQTDKECSRTTYFYK